MQLELESKGAGWLACQPIKRQQAGRGCEERRDELEEFLPSVILLLVQCRLGRGQARSDLVSVLLGFAWWWFGRVVYAAGRASA